MRKSFTSKIKKRRKKRTTTTITTTTAATNTSSSESDDEMSFIPNDKNFTDLTQDLIALELSEEDTNMDYEPGGDD
ncbi:unnamed protein product [Rotaria sordida]|uniref:Uncharacterized protein n=1 Tax=Rotaria sordida TaxID=392033 RepID=A0A820N2V9_9BILA|nr:unnamed protein product [Rotaria sordida]